MICSARDHRIKNICMAPVRPVNRALLIAEELCDNVPHVRERPRVIRGEIYETVSTGISDLIVVDLA